MSGGLTRPYAHWQLSWPILVRRGNEPGPLFIFEDGSPLSRPRFVTVVRQALAAAGVDPKPYSGHSFRIGAATTAAKKGVEDSTIKMLGRWKSSAYQLYIKTPRVARGSLKMVDRNGLRFQPEDAPVLLENMTLATLKRRRVILKAMR